MSVLKVKQLKKPSGSNQGAVVVYDTAGYPQWTSDIHSGVLLPSGSSATRPSSPTTGIVRYNTDNSQFEGYGPGNAWGSLGGVVSVDQKTKILAELSPGSADNKLFFYTGDGNGGSTEQMEVGNTYLRLPSGGTSTQPSSPTNGMIRYNNDLNRFEVRQNNSWPQVLTTGTNWGPANAGQYMQVNADGSDIQFVTFPTAVIQYSFRVNYTNSTKPTSAADIVNYPTYPQVPTTWTFSLVNNNNDIVVNHYMNQIPLFVYAAGWNTGIGDFPNGCLVLRSATATGLMLAYNPSASGNPNGMNTCTIMGTTSSATNATGGQYAIFYLYFLSTN